MTIIVDNRKKIEGKLFAEIGGGGSLMFTSGFFDGVGEDNEIRTELIISPEGIENLIDLLIERRLTMTGKTRVAEQRNVPVQSEHKCPRCDGRKKVRSLSNSDVACPMCNGTGISTRSDGG